MLKIIVVGSMKIMHVIKVFLPQGKLFWTERLVN